jgi:hypothetical protein
LAAVVASVDVSTASTAAKAAVKAAVETALEASQEALEKYINRVDIKSARLEPYKEGKMYVYEDPETGATRKCGGLTEYLRKTFYPHQKVTKRRFKKGQRYQKRASSSALGKRVDRDIVKLITFQHSSGAPKEDPSASKPVEPGAKAPAKKKRKTKKELKSPKLHTYTQQLVRFWDKKGMKPVAAQLFVPLPSLGKATQADVIVVDAQGQLWMHEIKTGWVGVTNTHGSFSGALEHVKYSKAAAWDLQRHYTAQGLLSAGLPLAGSRVVHIYEDQKRNEIKVDSRPLVFE